MIHYAAIMSTDGQSWKKIIKLLLSTFLTLQRGKVEPGHRAEKGLSLGPGWSAKILLVGQEVRELEQAGAKRPGEERGSLS